jgi:hypothetical protein
MLKRKHMIIGFLAFCLTATLLIGVTSSADYDPWVDVNDDGIIDIVDLVNVAIRFGEEGTLINKTALLLNLQKKVDSLNSSLIELQSEIDSIKEEMNQAKTIRFIDPTERVVNTSIDYEDVANFTWTPNDETNNAILYAVAYYEYKYGELNTPAPPYPYVATRLFVDDKYSDGGGFEIQNENYEWAVSGWGHACVPSQENYTIRFMCRMHGNEPAIFRNITVIITVVDGISPSIP